MTGGDENRAVEERRLFISHSSEDKPFVNRLIARLDGLGLERPWYDVFELGPTTPDISESLRSGISESAFFCLVLSPRSVRSQWVSAEINFAIQEDAPTLVALHDAPAGPGPFLLENPFVNDLLRGGQRKVINFSDFESGVADLLRAVAPELGEAFEAKRTLERMLHDPDPDEAEHAMTFAALRPELYFEPLMELLPKMSDDGRLAYRIERAFVHLRYASLEPLFDFLVIRRRPEPRDLAPPVAPNVVDSEHGDVYVGDRFTDMLRYMIMSGGNRRWFAQNGASRCLVAIARDDNSLRHTILEALGSYLENAVNVVPSLRGTELNDVEWDALRLVLDTAAAVGPAQEIDPFLVKQILSDHLWGDNALDAAAKLGPPAVRCLSAYATTDACSSLVEIARWENAVRAVYFEHETGVVSPNPWDDCFVGFGNRAVDPLLAAVSTHGDAFAPFVYRNLARIKNARAARTALRYALGVRDDDLLVLELVGHVGFTGVAQACDELLDAFLTGQLDEIRSGPFEDNINAALISAVAHADNAQVASEVCSRLVTGSAPALHGRLAASIATARLLKFVGVLEMWRTDAPDPYTRGRSAAALAALNALRDVRVLHRQLEEAEPDLEEPLVGIALSYVADEIAIEPLARGLRQTFEGANWGLHEEYATALERIPSTAASAARQKWYRRA